MNLFTNSYKKKKKDCFSILRSLLRIIQNPSQALPAYKLEETFVHQISFFSSHSFYLSVIFFIIIPTHSCLYLCLTNSIAACIMSLTKPHQTKSLKNLHFSKMHKFSGKLSTSPGQQSDVYRNENEKIRTDRSTYTELMKIFHNESTNNRPKAKQLNQSDPYDATIKTKNKFHFCNYCSFSCIWLYDLKLHIKKRHSYGN